MRTMKEGTAILAIALALAACGSDQEARGPRGMRPGVMQAAVGSFVYAVPLALVLQENDADGDRRITRAEFDGAVARIFAEADADRSGQIAALEFQTWARAALGSEEAQPGRLEFDTDLDGIISRAELVKGMADEFARLDKDGNGVLDRSELVMAPGGRPPQRPDGSGLRVNAGS
ncbi:MAG: hypothetical protein H6923_09830 [Alphaproteobacteria bacterium]|nr:hypothetical protein [Alphaproteobacteria bacterium]